MKPSEQTKKAQRKAEKKGRPRQGESASAALRRGLVESLARAKGQGEGYGSPATTEVSSLDQLSAPSRDVAGAADDKPANDAG